MRRAIATGVSCFLMACSDPAASDPPPTTIAAPPPPTEAPPPPEPEPLYESAELPPPTVVAPPTTVAPVGAGIVVSPHPIVLDGITGTLGHDPVDGRATLVATPSGEVRIAEVHALPGDVMDGAHMQAQLERIGARFTTSESTADRWAHAYDLDGHFSVQCGLVVDGHTYVCRGEYPDAAAQARALAVCRTMRGTGGAAVAPASGVIVGSCVHEQQCAQVHAVGDTITTEAVLQLADTCGMVGEIVQETPCPATVGGFPSEGRCVTPQGIDWVYYAHERRDECAAIGGTYTRP